MAGFQSGNLALIEGANSNAGRLWTYKYDTESIATISASGYFSTADTVTGLVATDMGLKDEDVINVHASDGLASIIMNITTAGVISVADNSTAGRRLVRAQYIWDVNTEATAGTTGIKGTYNLGVIIPDGAVITGAWYEVLETMKDDGDDSTTVAIQALAADDLVAAAAISTGTAFDATDPTTLVECIPVVETTSSFIKMTSAKELKLLLGDSGTIAMESGEMLIYVEYIQSRVVTA